MDHSKPRKILEELRIPDHLICFLRNLYAGQEATEPDIEQRTGFKLGKEYVEAVYCHPAYLTYMESTSCEMLDWVKHKLKSRLPREISVTSDMQLTTLMAESEEALKSLLMKVKEESEKAGLKLQLYSGSTKYIKKTKIMASGPISLGQIDGETMETVIDYFLGLKNHCRW